MMCIDLQYEVFNVLQSVSFFVLFFFPIVINFTSGCGAGVVATLVSFPFDILRTRMIGQGEPKVRTALGAEGVVH